MKRTFPPETSGSADSCDDPNDLEYLPKMQKMVCNDDNNIEENYRRLAKNCITEKEGLKSLFNNMDKDSIHKLVQCKDELGNTLLHFATLCSNKHAVQDLLKHGASVNAENHHKQIPLHQVSDADVCKLLVDFGGDTNAVDNNGLSVLDSAFLEHDVELVSFLFDRINFTDGGQSFKFFPANCTKKELFNIMFYNTRDPSTL